MLIMIVLVKHSNISNKNNGDDDDNDDNNGNIFLKITAALGVVIFLFGFSSNSIIFFQ